MLTVVSMLPTGLTSASHYVRPEIAAYTVEADLLLGNIERVIEFSGTADECAAYSETLRKLHSATGLTD